MFLYVNFKKKDCYFKLHPGEKLILGIITLLSTIGIDLRLGLSNHPKAPKVPTSHRLPKNVFRCF